MVKGYREPTRAGTPKGELIGFSCKKMYAARMMILFNPSVGLGLKGLSKIVHVSPGVLQVWRTQGEFKKAESETCNTVREIISKVIDIKSRRKEIESVAAEDVCIQELLKKLPLGIEGIDEDRMRFLLLEMLPFFNPLIANPLIQLIAKKIELSIPGYDGLALLLIKSTQIWDEKSFKKWKEQPEVKELIKKMIKTWIELISNPKARKELGSERIREAAETLKKFVFYQLDL